MRSTADGSAGDGRTPPPDLTARARIRGAAIRLIGEEGFDVSLRAIAARAGVSVGLVAHHFGSKDGLRRVCDEHVLAVLRDTKSESVGPGSASAVLAQLAEIEEYGPVVAYVLRTLQAGGDLAQAFVDQVTADTIAYLRHGVAVGTIVPSRDEEARARYVVGTSLGSLVFELTLDPIGADDHIGAWFRRYADRIVGPALESLTDGLLTDDSMLQAYLASRADDQHPRAGRPPGSRGGTTNPSGTEQQP